MDADELKRLDQDYENKLAAKDDWFNGGYYSDINSGQAYRETLGFIDNVHELQSQGQKMDALLNGGKNLLNSFVGTTQMVRDMRLLEVQKNEDISSMPGVNTVINTEIEKRLPTLKTVELHPEDEWDRVGYAMLENAIPFAAQMAAQIFTGPIGASAFMTSQISGAQYQELRDAGVSPERAFKYSLINGYLQGKLETIGMGKILGKLPAGSSLRKRATEIFYSMMEEGVTEGLQSILEQVTNIIAKNEGIDTQGVVKEYSKNAREYLADIAFSGLIGALFGGGVKGAGIVSGKLVNKVAEKVEKQITQSNNENLTNIVDTANKKGMNAQYVQATVDKIDGGQTLINLDAQQVISYAQEQQADIEKVATSLGVTAQDIQAAADDGLDITVSKGHMTQAMMEQNGFSEAMLPNISYGDQGKSLNYIQMQADMEEAYGQGNEAMKALDEELNAIEQSMLDADVPKDQAKQARELYNAFAVSMSPENPAEWIKNHKVRFANEGKVSKKDSLFQTVPNVESQAQEGKYKGTFNPQADGSFVINMLKGHDASTVIHETGHYFYEVFMQESGLDTASDKLKADRKAFLEYVGMTEEQWKAADFEGRRAAHERVATAFEQYLLEGKAPSKGLRGVFSRFSKWLKAVYGNVVNSKDYAELTDDVRQAFDHWLAADADIEQAARMQGYFGKLDNKLTANLSDKQKKWLEDKIYSAREKAIEILTKKYMENFAPRRRAEIEAYRKDIEPKIREAVHEYRVNKARRNIADNFAINKTVTKNDTKFKTVERNGMYFAVSGKSKVTITALANPQIIARKYMYVLGYRYKNYAEALNNVQNNIDAELNPIIENLKAGMGHKADVIYVDTETAQTLNFDDVEERDTSDKRYKKQFVSNNAVWYQNWYKKNKHRPNRQELVELARDIYSGKDEYGYYENAFMGQSLQEMQDAELEFKQNKSYIDMLFEVREGLTVNEDMQILVEKAKKYALTAEQRLEFDMIAEYLGYSSGSEMAQDILKSKTEEQMVREAVNDAIDKEFPDYLKERKQAELAVIEALNNDQDGEVIALEQQLIDEAAQTAFEREQTAQARMAKAAEAKAKAEVTARNTLLNMPIIEALNIRRFAMAERRAAASAKKAIKAGDFEAASEFKRQQMIAHAMVRYSAKLKQEVERTKKFVKRLLKLKKDSEHFGNEVNYDQIMFLLYRIGAIRYDKTNAERYKKQLAKYNPANHTLSLQDYITQMTDKLGDGVPDIDESVTNEMNDLRDSQNMTIEQYAKIRDALQNLYAIVKQDIQGTLDAKAKNFAENKENITENLNKLDDKYTPSIGGVDSESFIARQIAQRQSLDNFLEMMDDWTFGYFSKTFGAPLKHAADLQAKLTMEFEDAISADMKKWLPNAEARRAADTERYYEELGGNANKHTLVNMLIHLGNQSSMERLCTTRVEGAENSKLWVFPDANNNLSREEAIAMTRENLINFLGKYLTAADVEFAQAKVDAANKLWPLLAQVNIDTKGFAPAKVEATPVAFKPSDGDYMTFRGGYYPLARDSRLGSQRQGAEAFSSTEDGSAPIKTMSTVQSTSKSRTGANYPVKLNYGYEMGIIQDTIHDIAYRQVMMDFNKIFSDQQIASLMKRKLGLENFNVLKETLWKCARPRSLQDSVMAERSLTQAANWIRRKTVNAIIACNLKISLQNLGNVFLFGNTVEGFTQADVMAALPKIFSGLANHKAMRQEVFAKSIFMRERAKAPDFAMKEVAEENAIIKANKRAKGAVNQVTEKLTWAEENAQIFGAKMLEVTDNITAVPVWLQAYNKKLQAGASEQEAIDFADTVIRRTLGSNRLQDVSSIQRGSSMYKLFTAFQSFFNTQFNQWWREANIDYKLYTKGEYKEAFMRVMSFALSKWLFACLANTIIGSLSFIKPFEKDEKKKWRDITQELITYPIAMTGGVGGQVALASTQALLGMQSYGYRLSIIENTLTKGVSLGTKINAVAQGKKDIDELAEPVAEITAIMLGLPLQFVRTPANLLNIAFDDMSFELEDIMNRRRKSERNK